jgi:phosphoglucomutase
MNTQNIIAEAKKWLTSTFDQETQTKVQSLIDSDPDILADSFYKNIAFGTGGMRGLMGPGTNRINKYTLGKATQGLANYILQGNKASASSVVIAYDCRHNSDTLAKTVADVLTANGIKVFLFEDLRTTPALSFAVNYLNCTAGIVLTASHNPPEYNGYKVYWKDGGQIVPPNDGAIINEVNNLDYSEIKFDENSNLLEYIGEEVDTAFTDASVKNGCLELTNRDDLTIVFTSLHGTSITAMPQTLEKAGYKNVHLVPEQSKPDGDFPTVASPNPEEPAALKMAMELADKVGGDIVIGTDPDSDRVGIAVRDLNGDLKLLNGNQTMVVMTDFLMKKWQKEGKINGKQFVGTTIVSTDMVAEVAGSYDVETKICLTGFKWIAKMIVDFPELEFIGGGEESFGYMVGDFVRDKDAITSALLACEIATYAKSQGSSFYNELLQLYVKHNFYKEHLISITKKGMDGAAQIEQMMVDLRANAPKEIDGEKIEFAYDYDASICKNLITGEETVIDMPKANVLIFYTENGTRVAARPSGTEPKIKFYFSVNGPCTAIENAEQTEKELDIKIQRIIKGLNL